MHQQFDILIGPNGSIPAGEEDDPRGGSDELQNDIIDIEIVISVPISHAFETEPGA